MKLPQRNSRQRKIIDVLITGACITPHEGVELHGKLRMTVPELADVYANLVVRGCAVQVGPRIKASDELLEHFHMIERPAAEEVPVVPPRTRPEFRPLSSKHFVSSRGMREGSNDLRGVASVYAPFATTTNTQN
jgi:hypothetical protein